MAVLENQNLTQGRSGPDITHLESTQHDSTTGTATFTSQTTLVPCCSSVCDFWLVMLKCYKLSDWLVYSTTVIKPAGQTLFYWVICSTIDFKRVLLSKCRPKIQTCVQSFLMMIWPAFSFVCFYVDVVLHSKHTCVSASCFSLLSTVNNTVIILGVLTFALQLCLVLFILLRCWQLDNRIKAALKSPDSVNKPSGEYFTIDCLPVWLEIVVPSIS